MASHPVDGEALAVVTVLDRLLLSQPIDEPRVALKQTPVRAPDELEILNAIARDRGEGYADRWAEMILQQARDFGDL